MGYKESVRWFVGFEIVDYADLNLAAYFISFICYLLLFKSEAILQIQIDNQI